MLNLFDKETYFGICNRLNKLTPEAPAKWGKMNAAQMFAHCHKIFKIPLSNEPQPRLLISYMLGWLMKKKLYNDAPWRKGLPTSSHFKIVDERNFYKEKLKLAEDIAKFYSLGAKRMSRFPHPIFGDLTGEQWGKSMYKHLDHHFRQFGV